jgi:hypothetical protein
MGPSKHLKDSYGCVSWQPDLPSGETADSQSEKKEWLLEEFSKCSEERDLAKIQQYMDETYATQRFLLNGQDKLPAIALRSHWPFLMTGEGFLKHFDCLMGFNLKSRFEEHFSSKGRLLVSYAKRKGSSEAKRISSELHARSNILKNDIPLTFGSLQLLCHLLKEEQALLIMYEVCTSYMCIT